VENIDVVIDPFFTSEELNQLAKEAGFVVRKGKISGSIFMDLIVFKQSNLKKQSLNDLSGVLKDQGVDITKQSLHDRFNENALLFFKIALEKLLLKQMVQAQPFISEFDRFNRILIKDSTCFQIDESLAEYYPGSGGKGSSASVRIQFEYDVLSGAINDMSVNAFNEQDPKDSIATIELTKEGDLIIRDLAYMSFEVLKYISSNHRFFLCRAKPNAYIYELKDEEYVKVDFVEIDKYMKHIGIDTLEKELYLGNNEKLQIRLILHRLPANEIAKRIRTARANNLKNGGSGHLSKEHNARISFNLFITNASWDLIPTVQAWPLCRLR